MAFVPSHAARALNPAIRADSQFGYFVGASGARFIVSEIAPEHLADIAEPAVLIVACARDRGPILWIGAWSGRLMAGFSASGSPQIVTATDLATLAAAYPDARYYTHMLARDHTSRDDMIADILATQHCVDRHAA